uniref:Uncharacterized protein n=1 Tax=Ciona savignyi TaxID=51511 RepID=H2Z2I1_CIOSA
MDGESIWCKLPDEHQQILETEAANITRKTTLSCFAHTLQLCIGDGLKHTKEIRSTLSKGLTISTFVRTHFSKKLEEIFGQNHMLPHANQPPWISTYR